MGRMAEEFSVEVILAPRAHACAMHVCPCTHSPSPTLPAAPCSNFMSAGNLNMVNCGFFCFSPHLAIRFPGVSVFQTTDLLPEVSISKLLTCIWEPWSSTSDALCSARDCREPHGHFRAVRPINVGSGKADSKLIWSLPPGPYKCRRGAAPGLPSLRKG